ncbi:MFS peptide transporter [Pyronema omphalodes]|nr:MFS peptide transporter [Pyronema omphalodes]
MTAQHPVGHGNITTVSTGEQNVVPDVASSSEDKEDEPTAEELRTLPRVPGRSKFVSWTIAFMEMCERISFCGQIAVFQNFIQRGLPEGSPNGVGRGNIASGALGLGQRTATSISNFDVFLVYAMPLMGGYLADTRWGRYKTILIAIFVYLFGNAILIVAASPPLLEMPRASLALLIIAIIVQAMGTGSIKACTGTFLTEQSIDDRPKIASRNGERVIIDHELTVARTYQYLYLMLNIGAAGGSLAMVYAEQTYGFFAAFTIPFGCFCICPFIMWWGRKTYVRVAPNGSVLVTAWRATRLAMEGHWSWNPIETCRKLQDQHIWEAAKPSTMPFPEAIPEWMNYQDKWIDELRVGIKACPVFIFFSVLSLGTSQMHHNLTSQAATMKTHGLPNDFYTNINPIVLIATIPLLDQVVYPQLRKWKINFSPLRRIFCGFFLATLALIWCAVVQKKIYDLSPCGNHPNECSSDQYAPISAFWQSGPLALIAFAEILSVTTGMEYCFNNAPQNMRSIAYSLFLMMTAFASLLAQAFIPLSDDPRLINNYSVVSGILGINTIVFGCCYYKRDKEERSAAKKTKEETEEIELSDMVVMGADEEWEG